MSTTTPATRAIGHRSTGGFGYFHVYASTYEIYDFEALDYLYGAKPVDRPARPTAGPTIRSSSRRSTRPTRQPGDDRCPARKTFDDYIDLRAEHFSSIGIRDTDAKLWVGLRHRPRPASSRRTPTSRSATTAETI